MTLDQQIRARIDQIVMHPTSTWPALQLADGLRAALDFTEALENAYPHSAAGIRRTIATQLDIPLPGDQP